MVLFLHRDRDGELIIVNFNAVRLIAPTIDSRPLCGSTILFSGENKENRLTEITISESVDKIAEMLGRGGDAK